MEKVFLPLCLANSYFPVTACMTFTLTSLGPFPQDKTKSGAGQFPSPAQSPVLALRPHRNLPVPVCFYHKDAPPLTAETLAHQALCLAHYDNAISVYSVGKWMEEAT